MRMLSPLSTAWSLSRAGSSPDSFTDVFEDFDRIVNGLTRDRLNRDMNFQPSCDVQETKNHFLLSFDIPGVKRDDIKINIDGNQLLVSGERRNESKADERDSLIRHERFYGKFQRSFTLPTTVQVDKIEAHYDDGVLNIALPKAEEAKARSVKVQTGQSGFLDKLLGTKKDKADLKDVNAS